MKILFVTLTNIGDVILTLPALDLLRAAFPQSAISVVAGPRSAGLFDGNPSIAHFYPYNKHSSWLEKLRLFGRLREERFDLVLDLRNSLFGVLLGSVTKQFFLLAAAGKGHARDCHIARASLLIRKKEPAQANRCSVFTSDKDKEYVEGLLRQHGWIPGIRIAVISPGARSETKRWPKECYRELAARLQKSSDVVVLIGDAGEREITGYISHAVPGAVDLAGMTTLPQLAHLLSLSAVLVSNDSAAVHLAGYRDVPTVAVFGPTDDARYGPWSRRSRIVKKELSCRPCRKPQCAGYALRCLTSISVQEVEQAVSQVCRETSENP